MTLKFLISKLKGGAGSGHWNHAGRPGKHGGSSPGRGLSSLGLDKSSTLEERRSIVQALKKPVNDNYEEYSHDEMTSHYGSLSDDYHSLEGSHYEEARVLHKYTTSWYQTVNSVLRTGESTVADLTLNKVRKKQVASDVALMDKAFDRLGNVPNNVKVYRHMTPYVASQKAKLMAKMEPGVIFQDKGYVSTTVNKNNMSVAASITAEIRVPKGSKGIYVANISDYKNEHELLLNRDSKFRVISREIVEGMYGDRTHVVMELLP